MRIVVKLFCAVHIVKGQLLAGGDILDGKQCEVVTCLSAWSPTRAKMRMFGSQP